MLSWFSSAYSCLSPGRRRFTVISSDDEAVATAAEPFRWFRNLVRHSCGEFSYAVAQANAQIEDHSQVEIGTNALFVGVYDGHGGHDASLFVREHLFEKIISIAENTGNINEGVIREAIAATETEFMHHVENLVLQRPMIAAVGTCCLMGFIWRGTLYIANLGDSRAVLGRRRYSRIVPEQLTVEHNANRRKIRRELRALHPNDRDIVFFNHGSWRVKGIIQISRSIGDEYLKDSRFGLNETYVGQPITRPVVTAEPSLASRVLNPNYEFLIFASDGLWEHLSNQQAVDIVDRNPRHGIAKRLLKAALKEAAKKRNVLYTNLLRHPIGTRRTLHDDITVIVVFIDHHLLGQGQQRDFVQQVSIKGFVDEDPLPQSSFFRIQEHM